MSLLGVIGWCLIGAGVVVGVYALTAREPSLEPAHEPTYWPDFSGIVIPVEGLDD